MDNDLLHNVQHFILEHAFIVTYLHSLFRDLQNTLQHRPPTFRQYIKVEIYYPADMNDYLRPLLRKKPDEVILHAGTNNICDESPRSVAEGIVNLVTQIQHDFPTTHLAI